VVRRCCKSRVDLVDVVDLVDGVDKVDWWIKWTLAERADVMDGTAKDLTALEKMLVETGCGQTG